MFLLVEPGSYTVRASTNDGLLHANQQVEWQIGSPPVQLWLEPPGTGVLALAVEDERGESVFPFAVKVGGPDNYRRVVHSEDLAQGTFLTGLPDGDIKVQLIPRLKDPIEVYLDEPRVLAPLAGGEVKRITLKTRTASRYRVEVLGGANYEWEMQAFCAEALAWRPLSVRRFVDDGAEFSNWIRHPGTYYSDALKKTDNAVRLVRRDQPESIIVVDAPPWPGQVVPITVTLP